jgi:predicted nucleic acid-binding protein
VIVADASVLIAHLEASDPHHEQAIELLIEHADSPLGASTITLAEVLVGPAQADRLEDARAALDALGVLEVPLEARAAARLASLRARTGVKLPDCCVLLAAVDADADALLTFDQRLTRAAGEEGVATHPR